MAAQENHIEVVKYLLENGANQSTATEVSYIVLFFYTGSYFPLTLYSDRLKSEDFLECFENFHPFVSMSCIYEPYHFFLHAQKTKVKCSGSGEKG